MNQHHNTAAHSASNSHIVELRKKRKRITTEIREEEGRPAHDDLYIRQLKARRLHLKDLELLQRQKSATAH